MSGYSVRDIRGRTPRTSALIATAVLVALAALLGACGGGGGGDNPDPTSPKNPGTTTPVASATVAMSSRAGDGYSSEEHRFTPDDVRLRLGGTVTWSNATGVSHNVTFSAADGAPENVASHVSGSTARTFAKVGTFNYGCTNHAAMSGSIVVVE